MAIASFPYTLAERTQYPSEASEPALVSLEDLPVAALFVRLDGTITRANREAVKLLGYEPEALVGRDWSMIFEDTTALTAERAEVRALTRQRGRGLSVELRGRTLQGSSGKPLGLLIAIVEVAGATALQARLADIENATAELRRCLGLTSPQGGAGVDALPAEPRWGAEGLSPRQIEIAKRLVQGMAPKDVAGRLGLSVHTVRTQIKLLYVKLGVRSQLELAARLRRLSVQ